MTNITDKEITQVLLDEHKLCATSLTNLVLESSNQNLRTDVTNILGRTFQHQKQLFDIMAQKGWYQVQAATQQDITKAQQDLNKVQSSISNMSM